MRQEAGFVLLALALAPVVASPSLQGGAPGAPASKPASAPATADRLAEVQREVEHFAELRRAIVRGEAVDVEPLRKGLAPPAADSDRKTKTIRRRLEELESEWAVAREAREKAVSVAQQRVLAMQRVGPPIPEGPFPLPLADPDELRLGKLLLQRGEFEKAASVLSRAPGAEARYFEGRALDGANRVDEALTVYKQATEAAQGDARLLATLERAKRALDWKIQFGRPEDFGAPIRSPRSGGRSTP